MGTSMSEITIAATDRAPARRRVRSSRVVVVVGLAVVAMVALVLADGSGLRVAMGGPIHVALFGLSVWLYRWAAQAPAPSDRD